MIAIHLSLFSYLEIVSLDSQQELFAVGKPIQHVYFPTTAVVALFTSMKNGAMTEVAMVGHEGMLGLSLFMGFATAPTKAQTCIAGRAIRMKVRDFKNVVKESRPLQELLLRYMYPLLALVAQTAACNRLHTVRERLCCWLLMTHDRVWGDRFPLTQEIMAQLLGVGRPTVTAAAGMLQKAGLISYSRGKVTILDRKGLEAACCECYAAVREQFNRLYEKASAKPHRSKQRAHVTQQ